MRASTSARRQRGAVIITVCLFLLFLLGFMGFALDFSRLFVVKTELQTAMDACALSAAQEMDHLAGAVTRGQSAGARAANLNRVNMQSPTWDGKGQVIDANITFYDQNLALTTSDADARYVRCEHVQPSVRLWLLHAMGAFYGDTTRFPPTHNVFATAMATRGHSQTTCPIPVALRPKTGGAPAPDYGYTPGEWITLLMSQSSGPNGYIGWANMDGSNSASETEAELRGKCGVRTGDDLGTPGVQTSIADVWNSRFGIYKNTGDPAVDRPDFTGYAYTVTNWPSQRNAYSDFVTRRASFANCSGTTSTRVNDCESVIGRRLNSFQRLLPPGSGVANGHVTYGANRRIVVVPVTTTYPGEVQDYACMLMLQPLSIPMGDVQLEYIGNAADPGSPCVTSGLPGGAAGPLVPVLVR